MMLFQAKLDIMSYQSRGEIQISLTHSLSDALAACSTGGYEACIADVGAAACGRLVQCP
jgi:hypothetical protein